MFPVAKRIYYNDNTFEPWGVFLTKDFQYFKGPMRIVTPDIDTDVKPVNLNFDLASVYSLSKDYESALLLCQVLDYLNRRGIEWEQTYSPSISRSFASVYEFESFIGKKVYIQSVVLVKTYGSPDLPSLNGNHGIIRCRIDE